MVQRLFIAIDLPGPVRHVLARLVADAPHGARAVLGEQLHLTLHFLGDVEDDARERLTMALRQLRQPPFTMTIQGAGVFPNRGRPTVLWAGVAPSAPLTDLHAAVGRVLETCGHPLEQRGFVPHVTLARLAGGVSRSWLAALLQRGRDIVSADVAVDRFHLYASLRRDGRTEHTVLATIPLVGSTPACREGRRSTGAR